MIFTLIGIITIIYSFKNFKRAFLWLLVYKLLLVTNITVIALPGIPLLKWDMFLIAIFFLQFWRQRKVLAVESEPFPYERPFKFLVVSWFLSTIFAYIGFLGAVSQFIKNVFEQLVIVWMMWKLIDVRKDLPFIIKWFSVAFLFISLYGCYEYKLQANPLVEYEATLIKEEDRAVVFTYDAERGRGYRVQSVFEHAIGAGINWSMFLVFILSLVVVYRYKLKNKYFVWTSTLLAVPCVFFANSRAPILFLMLAIWAVISFKNKRTFQLLVVGMVGFVIVSPYLADYAANVLSIFDSKAQDEVGGSNAEMRFNQLAAAIALLEQSPFVGFGFKFLNGMNNSLTAALLGMESMWFGILTQFGLLGVAANLFYAYYALWKVPHHYKSKPVFFFSLAYWVVGSLTSVPGMLIYMYYLFIIIFIKLSPQYDKRIAHGNERQTNGKKRF